MATKSFTKSSYSNSFVICIIAIAILLLTLLMQSCKNNDPAPESRITLLSVTNASPTLATYNFYLNNTKVHNGALPFGGGIPYIRLNPGIFAAKLTTESSTESLLSENLTLENGEAYSLFVIEKGTALDYLLIKDEIKTPGEDKARVRFINLSPDAPALNIATKDGVAIATDKAFKAASEFIEIPAKVYTFEIKDKTTGALKTEIKDFDIKKGKMYTIISRGMLTPTGTEHPLSGQITAVQ
jgi:hypothetical protein